MSVAAEQAAPVDGLLTGAELVAWLADRGHGEWEPETLRKWITHPVRPCPVARRGKPGRDHLYDPWAVAAWIADREAREVRAADPDSELKTQRARLARLQADQAEGLLVPAADVEEAWGRMVDATRQALLSAHHVIGDRLGLDDEQRAVVQAVHADALERLASGHALDDDEAAAS